MPLPGVVRTLELPYVSAFTLTEVLVVITIIAILASLLLPSVFRSKVLGERAVCQSNLRQLSLSLTLYAEDCGRFPPLRRLTTVFDPIRHNKGTSVSLWNAHVLPYVSSNRYVFNCPAFPRNYKWSLAPSEARYSFPTNIQGNRPFCYSANVKGVSTSGALGLADGHGGLGRKPAEIRVPSDMVALGDEVIQNPVVHGKSNEFGSWGILDIQNAIRNRVDGYLHISRVHNDGANMAFLDGHVEWAKWWKWIEPTDAAARRWNFDNQPHREYWDQ